MRAPPLSLSAPRGDRSSPRHAIWGGTRLSRPYLAALRPSGTQNHRTRQQAHTRGVSTQASKRGKGGGGTTLSHHPKQARQHQSTQTPKGEHAPRVNTKPSHPQANTPTTSPNKARPQANTKSAHARARGQARCVSEGGPACPGRGDRHEAKQAKPPQGRARRTSAHKASAQTTWFAPKRCRPAPARRGRAASERPLTIAHARARGLLCLWACLRTFVGFFGLWVLGVWVFFGGGWCVFWFFDIFGL